MPFFKGKAFFVLQQAQPPSSQQADVAAEIRRTLALIADKERQVEAIQAAKLEADVMIHRLMEEIASLKLTVVTWRNMLNEAARR